METNEAKVTALDAAPSLELQLTCTSGEVMAF